MRCMPAFGVPVSGLLLAPSREEASSRRYSIASEEIVSMLAIARIRDVSNSTPLMMLPIAGVTM
jgi:hypothetical protein